MTDSVHKNLTGADLHEPKGADSALAGQVYVSDGAGSGSWVDASSVLVNTAWSTGDAKLTHKVTADATWIMWSDGTIGDSSSSASIRANADCSDLFTFYWTNYSNTLCPVSSGRGASAAADFAAHKTLALPLGAGRALGLAGTGSGLTARSVGTNTGVESVTLSTAQIPSHFHAANIFDPGHIHTYLKANPSGLGATGGGNGESLNKNDNTILTDTSTATTSVRVTSSNGNDTTFSAGGGGSHTNMQPTTFMNVMIKL